MLRAFGAKIGREVHVHSSVRIIMPKNLTLGDYTAVGDRVLLYALGQIDIGANTTISQNAHLCAGSHDYRSASMPLLKPPISIGDGAWICADAFIGPDVRVGALAIVGARAVVVKDVASNTIVAGNPARAIGIRPAAPGT
jgi:putative colanic acid biosynthesis acetyltransferase WcaF